MIFDRTLRLSNRQAITGNAVSTNVIDLGAVGTAHRHAAPLARNLGIGACIPFLIQVVEDFAIAEGNPTLTVALQSSNAEGFGSGVTTVWSSGAIPLANLKAGENLGLVNYIPKGVGDAGIRDRYFRLNYTVASGPFTAGRITAGVVGAVQTAPLG